MHGSVLAVAWYGGLIKARFKRLRLIAVSAGEQSVSIAHITGSRMQCRNMTRPGL